MVNRVKKILLSTECLENSVLLRYNIPPSPESKDRRHIILCLSVVLCNLLCPQTSIISVTVYLYKGLTLIRQINYEMVYM